MEAAGVAAGLGCWRAPGSEVELPAAEDDDDAGDKGARDDIREEDPICRSRNIGADIGVSHGETEAGDPDEGKRHKAIGVGY